ncbi:MAG: Bcr/CflA family multidrug efflux MFS transporter [Alphaproteobacteria bacterium]|nr:Bcr/CflA family multidrug efflux MFS transporter [Alphaproteobacteria bacterium]
MTIDAGVARPSLTPVLIVVLAVLSAFAPLSIDMYLPALPALSSDFRASPADVQLTLTSFMLAFGFGQIVYGPLGDRFGRRPVMLTGIAIYLVASVACAYAARIEHLIALRFIQGLSACGGVVMARAMVRDLADRDRAAQVMSVMMACVSIAPMVAPLMGAAVLDVAGWRAIFWTLAAFGLVALLAGVLGARETLRPERRAPLVLSAVLARFLGLIRSRHFIGYALPPAFLFGAMVAFLSGSPFVYIDHYRLAPGEYAWLFAVNVVAMTVGSTLNSRLVPRYGADLLLRRVVLAPALVGMALLVCGFIETRTGVLGLAPFVPLTVLMVGSMSLILPNSNACALQRYPHIAGTAASLAGVLQFGIGAAFGTLAGHLIDGTILPMTTLMGIGGILCFVMHRLLAPR